MKRKISRYLVLLLVLVMGIGAAYAAMNRDAGAGATTPPDTAKTLTPNGDGTYTLSLSVTGRAESNSTSGRADVIVVLDRSGSMDDEEASYTEHSTGRYGLVGGSYVNLYRQRLVGYTQLNNDSYSGTVYYRTGAWPNESYQVYTGTRYKQGTRLDVAKSAVNSLADQLLDNNTAADPDKVRLSLVTFANQASTDLGWTTNRSTFHDRVNNISADGGTNWEDALHDANAIQAREGAEVYVIFVSDGNPTYRNTKGGNGYSGDYAQHGSNPNYYYGNGNSDPNNNNFNYALIEAQNIVNADKNLYSVGAFGDATKMQNLATQSGAPASHYYDATDQAALNAAFTNIINEITSAFGYKDVKIEDGITGMTSAFVKTDPNSFTYTRSGGAYGGGAAWNGAPSASYAGGKVTWDLGGAQLEDGVTYTLSFKVWPSQEAYDLVADLNNGIKTYDSLTPNQQEQIADIGGGYGLKTNTDVTFSYTQIETITTNQEPEGYVEGQPAADGYTYTYDPASGIYTGTMETEGTCSPANPDPMPLTNSKMYVEKQWDDSVDPTQRPNEVRLGIRRDDNSYTEVILNAANGWTQEIDVAPGLIANGETLETGHDYTIEEIDPDYHFELDADPFHPMIVDGVLKKAANASGAGQATATATNVLRSRLQISKTVEHDAGLTPNPDQLFTYRIKVTDKKGGDVWFSIGNNSGPIDVSDQNRVTGATVNDADKRYYYTASGTEITVKIKGGENIYFTNLPKDSTYEVEEVDVPSGYSCTVTNSDDSAAVTGNKTSGTISKGNTLYSASYSNEYSVTQTTAKIPVNKVLSIPAGHAGPGDITGKYTFTLTAEGNAPLPQVTSYTNPDADGGKVEFGDITYTEPGTYTYHVDETGGVDGVSNDPNASKNITVEVTDKGDGTLGVEVNGANPTADDPANTTFTNSYSTTEVSVEIPITKNLTVPQGLSGPGDITGRYTFTLVPQDGAPMPAAGGDTVTNPAATGGTASFGSITYDAAGTYTYKITETGTVDGVTNDPAAAGGKTVTVKVSDDAHGHLSAVIEGADSTPAEPESSTTFTNTYVATPAKVSIPVKKVLNAAAGLTPPDISNQFTFTLEKAANSPTGTPMPPAGGETVTNPDANGGTVSFDEISYDRVGTYTYTVKESGTVAGIQNDTGTKTVTVTVTDDGNGKLSAAASVSANDPVTFTNTYSVNPVTAAVPVTKVLTVPQGLAGPTSIKESYTFTLTPQGGAPAAAVSTVKNPDTDGGTASFGAITYTKPGTYTYKITEAGDVAGVTNDPDAAGGKTITIEVRDNSDGTMTATIRGADSTAGNSTQNTTFTNVYAAESAKARIPVVKLLAYAPGLKPSDITGKYEFTLTGGANAPMPSAGGETVTNPASTGGTANFGEIEYTIPGTYTYTITEAGTVDGVMNDPDATSGKTVKVVVEDNKDGSLSAEVHGADEAGQSISAYTTFTNTYKASGSVVLEAAKIAEGFELKADQFSFELKDDDGNVLQTKKNNVDGGIVFDAITYSAPDSYHYTINEVIIENDGITDDTHTADVTVTVKDNGDGTLTATPQYEDATFTNKHKDAEKDVASAADTNTSVDGELAQAGDTLTYTITYANNTDSEATVTITDTIPANTTYVDGSASNGGVESNGTITWTIENVAAGATGTVNFQVKVNADANGETIENTANVSDGENQSSSNAVTTSVPVKDVKDDGGTSVNGGSTQVGDTLTYEVTFKLTKDCTDVVVTDDVPANTTYVDGSASDGGVQDSGTITWNLGALTAGTYTVRFKVTVDESAVTADAITNTASISVNNHAEVKTNTTTTTAEKGGLTISKEIYVPNGFEIDANKTFTFTVSLTDKNGNALTGAYQYTGSSEGTVSNGGEIVLKHGESVTIEGLPAGTKYKVVETAETGYTAVQDTFEATIPKDGNAAAAFKNKYGDNVETTVSFPVKKALTKATGLTGPDITEDFTFRLSTDAGNPVPDVIELKNPDADGGTVTFGPITYDTPGIYIYTIKETGNVGGVTNDPEADNGKTVTVTVKDNGDGSLTATASSTDDNPLTFTNHYGVNPVKAAITAKKLLKNADLTAGAFNFKLSAVTDGAPMPASENATNAADGTISFGDISYSTPGTYKYKIKEIAGSATYFEYDSTEKEVIVEVTDNKDGTLIAAVTGGGEDAEFINRYKAESDEIFISAVKNVNGEAARNNIFEFTIEADDGGKLPDETTVGNNGGSVSFGPIKYDSDIFDGTAPGAGTGNPAPKTVSITFTPDSSIQANTLKARLDADGAEGEPVDLEKDENGVWKPYKWTGLPNENAGGNDIAYEVYYSVDGGDFKRISGNSGMVDLELEGDNGNSTAQADRTKVFHYTIREKAGNAQGYTYDTGNEEKVTVTVTHNGSGKLDVKVEYDDNGAVFNNTYKASGEATITANKVLKGAELEADQFEFGLFEGDKKIGDSVRNDKDGKITFKVPYSVSEDKSDVGTHSYTIRELVADPQTGYSYDSASKSVAVNVTDNGDGTLDAKVIKGDDQTFTNVYKPLPTSVVLEAEKVLEGRKLVAGEFSFKVMDKDGKAVTGATNDADGKITFPAIPLTEEGTHEFTVVEVDGGTDGIVYDESEYTYRVVVKDGDGQLTVKEVTTDGIDKAVFKNTYTDGHKDPGDPDNPKTGDDNRLLAWLLLITGGLVSAPAIAVARRRRN